MVRLAGGFGDSGVRGLSGGPGFGGEVGGGG